MRKICIARKYKLQKLRMPGFDFHKNDHGCKFRKIHHGYVANCGGYDDETEKANDFIDPVISVRVFFFDNDAVRFCVCRRHTAGIFCA